MKKQTRVSYKHSSVATRISAIRAWRQAIPINIIADNLEVHRMTVSRWIRQYKLDGRTSLRPRVRSGRPNKVDCEAHSDKIIEIIKTDPAMLGFDNSLWNSKIINEALKKHLKLNISDRTVRRVLRNLGLSYQKPERRALEQDPEKRKKWLEKEWAKIRETAKKKRASIFFGDEAVVSVSDFRGKTWAPKGETPIRKVSTSRATVSVISAISMTGKLYFKLPNTNVNAKVFVSFLKGLLNEVKRKTIFLILDNAASHKAIIVKDFIAKNERLQVFYLPPYSPECNPDEHTWGYLKDTLLKGHTAKNKHDLRKKTSSAMRTIKKRTRIVKSFVKRVYVT